MAPPPPSLPGALTEALDDATGLSPLGTSPSFCSKGAASHCRILIGVTMANGHTGEKYQVRHNGKNLTRHNGEKNFQV